MSEPGSQGLLASPIGPSRQWRRPGRGAALRPCWAPVSASDQRLFAAELAKRRGSRSSPRPSTPHRPAPCAELAAALSSQKGDEGYAAAHGEIDLQLKTRGDMSPDTTARSFQHTNHFSM